MSGVLAEAAEARCARLQQALGAYRSALRSGESESERLRVMGNEALAGLDTPAEDHDLEAEPNDGFAPAADKQVWREKTAGERWRPADSQPSGWVCDREDCQGRPADNQPVYCVCGNILGSESCCRQPEDGTA